MLRIILQMKKLRKDEIPSSLRKKLLNCVSGLTENIIIYSFMAGHQQSFSHPVYWEQEQIQPVKLGGKFQ